MRISLLSLFLVLHLASCAKRPNTVSWYQEPMNPHLSQSHHSKCYSISNKRMIKIDNDLQILREGANRN